uniref:6,7-dimethyl-8-ribityllumazine synthase n=1 Tax=Candidatus Kentrum sp. MB TaxID=2138164 RepID=A0A450XL80_9GAMM|nr:MAG: 6,7-dimethyl-8-ribityllumazine synthase [Candidatus Kentron sp. MB]VFK29979.1 MAG: 6,7-dimethyl-8-ribityllumazine synthase [Candidatus Kentron sp. MB]VFK75007.1 MAG: 6,7-dimethyl-8-ribityllumazine synthase [Candidatus Kentron sp. MB]
MKANIAVVIGSYHKKEGEEMLNEVRDYAKKNDDVRIVDERWVYGSLEQPLVLKQLLMNSRVDGAVVLGIIERGETKHGLVMAEAVINAIIQLQLEFMKPVGVGIIGPEVFPSQIPSRLKAHALAAIEAAMGILRYNKG